MTLSAEFAAFMAASPAVRFGDFTLRSGMKTGVFFNFGDLCSGEHLARMGSFFARGIVEGGLGDAEVMYGPAYKAIVIATAASAALWTEHGIDMPIAYNRKEAKGHGEGGDLVGADLKGKRVILLDDVIADGLTKHETVAALGAIPGFTITGMVVGIDRLDKAPDGRTAMDVFKAKTGIKSVALTTSAEILKLR